MRNKVLFCATVDYHFKAFHLPYLKWFKDQGWEVHVAASGNMDLPFVDKKHTICIERSPFRLKNLLAYSQLKNLMKKYQYQLVHCHTPMGGMLTRLATRNSRKQGTKVLYTAHGFHFCKGAPLLNWLLYYPIERWMARYTDCLITINQEDYQLVIKHGFRAKRVEQVHGVGVDTDRFKLIGETRKQEIRSQLGYDPHQFLMFYAAEFNKNKNQQLLIRVLSIVKNDIPNARLILAGEGSLLESCKELAIKLGVEKMVDFLGYRNDLDLLLPICDLAVASSLREGLPVNVLEAMACGLPVVATQNRGHIELTKDDVNGYVIPINDARQFAIRISELFHSKQKRIRMGRRSRNIVKRFSHVAVGSELIKIYSKYMIGDANDTQNQYYRTYI